MAHSAASSISSDDEDTEFIDSDWIGKGKKYPAKSTPAFIVNARNRRLATPIAALKLLPSKIDPVSTLLSYDIPNQAVQFFLFKDSNLFSQLPPTIDIQVLLTRDVPPPSQLKKLREDFGQAWFNGCQSIVDKRYSDGGGLPLWAITFWERLVELRQAQKIWKKSWMWCTDEIERRHKKMDLATVKLLEDTLAQLKVLPWDVTMDYDIWDDVQTLSLASFLSAEWMADTHVAIMLHMVSQRLSETAQASTVLIASRMFTEDILNVDRRLKLPEKRWNRTVLKRYEQEIREKGKEVLYFPLNVNGNHWIAGKIDFVNHTISYGAL